MTGKHAQLDAAASKPKWIPLFEAFDHVIRSVGARSSADAGLRQALDDGSLRHRVGCGRFPAGQEILNEPAPAGFWRYPTRVRWGEDHAIGTGPSPFVALRVFVAEDDLFKLWPPVVEREVSPKSQAVREPRKKGHPTEIDWDLVFGQVLALVHNQGVPTNERAFAKKVCDYCSKAGLERVPSDRSVRDKLPIWLSELRSRTFRK